MAQVIRAHLYLKVLLGVGLGAGHDTSIQNQQIQAGLGGIDVYRQGLHRLQVCKIQLLDDRRPLQVSRYPIILQHSEQV